MPCRFQALSIIAAVSPIICFISVTGEWLVTCVFLRARLHQCEISHSQFGENPSQERRAFPRLRRRHLLSLVNCGVGSAHLAIYSTYCTSSMYHSEGTYLEPVDRHLARTPNWVPLPHTVGYLGPPRAICGNGAPCIETHLGESGVPNLGESPYSPTHSLVPRQAHSPCVELKLCYTMQNLSETPQAKPSHMVPQKCS